MKTDSKRAVHHTYSYFIPFPVSPVAQACKHSSEAVVVAHAQSQVETVILHTLFTTFTFYSQFFFWELADSRKHQHQNGVALYPNLIHSMHGRIQTNPLGS
jgi:hypothetical protein